MNQKQLLDLKEFYKQPGKEQASRLIELSDDRVEILHFVTSEVKAIDEASATIVHFISTPRIDPVMDVMNPFGINDRSLMKNKSVFYNHKWWGGQDVPIGKSLWRKAQRDGVLAKTEYAVNVTDFAKDIFNLVKGGFLNSYSIGFIPTDYSLLSLEQLMDVIKNQFDIPNLSDFPDKTQKVILHNAWECYEYSQVGVPMNEDAVVQQQIRKALHDGVIKSDFGKQFFGSVAGRESINLTEQEKLNIISDFGKQFFLTEQEKLNIVPVEHINNTCPECKKTTQCKCSEDVHKVHPQEKTEFVCEECLEKKKVADLTSIEQTKPLITSQEEEKSGQVLSNKNKEKLQKAHQHIKEVLADAGAGEEHEAMHCKGCKGGECKGQHCESCGPKSASCKGSHCDSCDGTEHEATHCKGCSEKSFENTVMNLLDSILDVQAKIIMKMNEKVEKKIEDSKPTPVAAEIAVDASTFMNSAVSGAVSKLKGEVK